MKTQPFNFFRFLWEKIHEVWDLFVLWLYAILFAWAVAIFVSFFTRKRMSHDNGIGATGWVQIVDNPQFPPHEFFAPGQQYPLRIRHASAASFLDDAMNCIRSMSLKFSNERFKSPFDLELNSGERSVFWSAASFLKFASMRKGAWGVEYEEFMRRYPDGLDGAKKGAMRRATSFQYLHYYSKTPFLYLGTDGIRRYAKYRVLPFHQTEPGIAPDEPPPSDWDEANARVLPDETRGRNYLKQEYEERVKTQGAKYRLQLQLRTASDDDDPEVFNNMVVWDEQFYPWMDLAVMEIDTILDWKESTLTTFSINNMPKTLGVLKAKSIYDYNSLNYLRSHSEIARKARMLSYFFFGMVPPIPDNDLRNVSDWGR